MNAVLAGLVGSYTSRNNDLHGYWLLGQVPIDSWPAVIDLLGEPSAGDAPEDVARRTAIATFRDQIQKSGLRIDRVSEAALEIFTSRDSVRGWQGDFGSDGRELRFVARAKLSNGRTYASARTVFVAPHDPAKESRRLQPDGGA